MPGKRSRFLFPLNQWLSQDTKHAVAPQVRLLPALYISLSIYPSINKYMCINIHIYIYIYTFQPRLALPGKRSRFLFPLNHWLTQGTKHDVAAQVESYTLNPCLCVYTYIYLSLYKYVSIHLYIYIYIYVNVFVYISLCSPSTRGSLKTRRMPSLRRRTAPMGHGRMAPRMSMALMTDTNQSA